MRVVPNRFPAVSPDGGVERAPPPLHGLHESEAGRGHHEVVIESDRHDATIATLSDERVATLLKAYRDRVDRLRGREGVRHVVVFRNGGPRSGASLTHPHTQIAALPWPPPETEAEFARLEAHHAATGRCLACDRVEAELADGARVVDERDGWVAFVPYAARFPAQVCVTGRAHTGSFADTEDAALASLAPLVRGVVARLGAAFDAPSFNWTLHAWGRTPAAGAHWRLDVLPRLAQVGGFELATGVFINGIPPEAAAQALRDAPVR